MQYICTQERVLAMAQVNLLRAAAQSDPFIKHSNGSKIEPTLKIDPTAKPLPQKSGF